MMNFNDNETRNFYFSMPYFGYQSEKMRVELCNLLKQYFTTIKFNIILVNHHTIGSHFKHQDTLNKSMSSAVAYIYTRTTFMMQFRCDSPASKSYL